MVHNWISVSIALVILSLLPGTTMASAPPDADDSTILRDFYSANGLLNRGLYELAVSDYRTFLESHGDHEKALVARYGLGVSLYRLDRLNEAQEALFPLLDHPQFEYEAEVLLILGRCRASAGANDEAADHFRRILKRYPEHDLADDAACFLAEALYASRAFSKVANPCEILIERWPDSPRRERAELFRGFADMALEHYGEGIQHFEAMLKRFPKGEHADQVSLLYAKCLHLSGALQKATHQYREIIEQGEAQFVPDALFGLARLLYEDDRLDDSGVLLKGLLKRYKDHDLQSPAHLLLGRIYFQQDKNDLALRQFQQLAKLAPAYRDDAAYWSAKCAFQQGKYRQTERQLAEAVEQYKESELLPQMIYDRAVSLLRLDRDEDAIEILNAFLDGFPEDKLAPNARYAIASSQHERARYDECRETCGDFVKQHPKHRLLAAVRFLAAENEYLAGRNEEAVEQYGQFLDEYNEDERASVARYRLGMGLYRLGRFDEAKPYLDQSTIVVEEHPEFAPALRALGEGYFQNEDWSEAESNLTAYLGQHPDDASRSDVLLKLGLARSHQDNPDGAREAFELLLELDADSPQHLQGMFELGQVLVKTNHPSRAKQMFLEVIKQGDDTRYAPYAFEHLGVLAMKEAVYPEAAIYFENAAHTSRGTKRESTLRYQQGLAWYEAGDFEKAGECFLQIARDFPDDTLTPAATGRYALTLARRQRDDEATLALTRVLDQFSEDLDDELKATLFYELAWSQRRLKNPQEAAIAYRGLLSLSDELRLAPHGRMELAELEMDADRYDEATELLLPLVEENKSRESVPDDLLARAAYRLGICAYRLDKFNIAADRLDAFIHHYPEHELIPSAMLLCGEAAFRSGAFKTAAKHLEHAAAFEDMDEIHKPALLRLGECHAALQHWTKSEQAFAQYLKEFAEEDLWFQARFGMGWAKENQGDHQGAIVDYQAVVDKHQGPTAARAQFQIGECLFSQKKHEEAITALLRVDMLYDTPEWSAAALYEAGRCFESMGQVMEARDQFQRVCDHHENSEWAELAARRLRELPAAVPPGHPGS